MKTKPKHQKSNNKILINVGIIILVIIFITSMIYLCFYFVNRKKEIAKNQNILEKLNIENTEVDENQNLKKSKRILELQEIQKENNDIVAWIEIEGTNINYPVLQTSDNEFYLDHNYKKEKAQTGSLFLDKDFYMSKPSTNYLIYGHRNRYGLMFEDLIKYKEKEFYDEHKKIRFTTNNEDAQYDIVSVFYSKVYYKSDKNVFRYYYFIDAKNEDEYNEYIENSKSAGIYDTGVTAKYGEQLLTLSTCEYSQENGRFVIVAKKE